MVAVRCEVPLLSSHLQSEEIFRPTSKDDPGNDDDDDDDDDDDQPGGLTTGRGRV